VFGCVINLASSQYKMHFRSRSCVTFQRQCLSNENHLLEIKRTLVVIWLQINWH
jgi:hypothetical protein